jgi:hypothetical protein
MGTPEDTSALRQHVFTLPEFRAQTQLVFEEERSLLRYSLRHFAGEPLFFYFSSIDQNSRMLSGRDESELLEVYHAVDECIGEVRTQFPTTELIVISRPTIRNRFYTVYRRLKWYRTKGFVSACVRKIATRLGKTSAQQAQVISNDKARFAEDRSLEREDLRIKSPDVRWSLPYQPSSESIFRNALQHIQITFSDYVSIDIGSGKGFVLPLAAEYPFKGIIGIEFSETLYAMALENIRTVKNSPIRCLCSDPTDIVLPSEPTVIYLFNPFQGKLMDRMIANIKKSLQQNPRDLWIVYVNPWEDREIPAFPRIYAHSFAS